MPRGVTTPSGIFKKASEVHIFKDFRGFSSSERGIRTLDTAGMNRML